MLEQLTTYLYNNPRKLFLIDGVGAIVSAFLLGVILVRLENIFRIPASTLYVLASLPVVFASYDFYNYQKEHSKLSTFLKGIAIMNLLYCLLSIGCAFFHYQTITQWGWTYIMAEVTVVIALALLELRVAKRLNTNTSI